MDAKIFKNYLNYENYERRRKSKKMLLFYFIEATPFESHALWRDYKDNVDWKEDCRGYWAEIGKLGKNMPVYVSFRFAVINDKRVCFYETTSRFNDTVMVKDYIENQCNCKKITNSDNFHNVILTIQ